MSNTWLTSDQHYYHSNILSFKRQDGSPARPFSSVEEMNETMIANYNAVVSKNDKTYFLGDLCFSATAFHEIMPRLNGTKVLIKGNHDNLKMSAYMQYFKDVRSYHILDKMLLSHIPIHPASIERFRCNVHGHLHHNLVPNGDKYINVCVEHTNYTPISFEAVKDIAKSRGLYE